MTAKEALRERIDDLTEEEAEEWLARIEWESTEFDELTEAEHQSWTEGKRQIAAGDWVDGDELFKKLNL